MKNLVRFLGQTLLVTGLGASLVACKADLPADGSGTGSGKGSTQSGQGNRHRADTLPGEGGSVGSGNGRNNNGDSGLISSFKPALVIRASGCLMCHARVAANVITDFGYGSSYYFGGQLPSGLSPFSGAIYGDHAENWRTASVYGKIVVPRATVPSQAGSLADYLRAPVGRPDANTAAPLVEEKQTIWIGAPTEARLRQVAGVFPAAHPQWKNVSSAGAVSGLELAPGGQYVQNTPGQELVCRGDVVVDAVLFLNSLSLRTDDGGCRLYTTRSVFIQGPIAFSGDAPDRNLQISSSRAIVLGMGPGATDGQPDNTLSNRLRDFWTRGSYFTRDTSRSTQEKLDDIVLDSSYLSGLRDASSQAPWRRTVHFERTFLNAPNFQSRYQGEFKGVIVAEVAIGSLGNFAFKFDDVFSRVPILPLISERDYLQVE